MSEVARAILTALLQFGSYESEEGADKKDNVDHQLGVSYPNGTSNGQIDLIYNEINTLGATATKDYDLDGGAMESPLENALVYADVQLLLIQNTGTGDLQIYGDFLGLSAEFMPIEPRGFMLLECGTTGRAITAGTADVVTVKSIAGTDYEISFLGRSA